MMNRRTLISDLFTRISEELERVLEGLPAGDLNRQPSPDSNSIGWLLWHLTRSHDRNMSEIAGREQVWIRDGWYARFGREPDAGETGAKHTVEQAAAFNAPDSETILGYHRAVSGEIQDYLETVTDDELACQSTSPTLGITNTVRGRLVGVLSEGFQHAGQAAYVRGLLCGRGWSGR